MSNVLEEVIKYLEEARYVSLTLFPVPDAIAETARGRINDMYDIEFSLTRHNPDGYVARMKGSIGDECFEIVQSEIPGKYAGQFESGHLVELQVRASNRQLLDGRISVPGGIISLTLAPICGLQNEFFGYDLGLSYQRKT